MPMERRGQTAMAFRKQEGEARKTMTKTSIGVQDLRRRIAIQAKADGQKRFWGLYTHVWKLDVLEAGWRMAKANRGAPGVDGKSFDDIEKDGLHKLLHILSDELKGETYRPLPLREVKIPKANGKTRTIKIASIRDRIVQGALKIVLEPIFEMDFQNGSFGYRPKRSAHQAISHVWNGINKQLTDVLDIDLKAYFDTVRHDLLLNRIAARVNDSRIMRLCKQVLRAGGKRGLPQGSIIGPVFSNLFLNDIDKMLEKAQSVTRKGRYETIRYARYADDLVILVSSAPWSQKARWGDKVMLRVEQELEKLDLKINKEKTRRLDLKAGESFGFLGYQFQLYKHHSMPNRHRIALGPKREKRTDFLKRVSLTLKRNRFRPVEEVIRNELNPMIRGWVNYFRLESCRRDLCYVKWQIEGRIRRFATRQRPKKRGGRRWTKWSTDEIYKVWGLYSDYKPIRVVSSHPKVT